MTERECREDPDRQSNDNRFGSLIHGQARHVAGLRTERHSDANFACALFHCVSDCAVNSNARQKKSDTGKDSEQPLIKRAWPSAWATTASIVCGNEFPGRIHFSQRGLNELVTWSTF